MQYVVHVHGLPRASGTSGLPLPRRRHAMRKNAPAMRDANGLQLGGTNFGYLNACGLAESLEHLASCGMSTVELGLTAPHFDLHTATPADFSAARRALADAGLRCSSVNAAELNLISQNEAVAQLAVSQCSALIRAAAGFGAPYAVIVPGRQHPLRPMPAGIALDRFERHMAVLLRVAEAEGVSIALETVPFGFLQTVGELAAWLDKAGHASLSMVVDCANVFVQEDPVAALGAAGRRMSLCHVSDAWKSRWAHTSIGSGEIDFAAIGRALEESGFAGPTIYELMDADDPRPRLDRDLARLETWGWRRAAAAPREP